MEFRPNEDPRTFAGNLTYYLDKIEEEEKNNAAPAASNKAQTKTASSSPQPSAKQAQQPRLNPKERRKREAAKREKRNKVLKPLQADFEKIEKQIAELEAAQATISAHLEKPETIGNPEELKKATQAYEQSSQKLTAAFTKWETISEQIEKLETELAT